MIKIKNISSNLCFSSTLSEIIISSDNEYVNVIITASAESGDLLFSEKMWLYDGSLSIFNLHNLMESYMRDHFMPFCNFFLKAYNGEDSDLVELKVAYCSVLNLSDADPDSFFAENFLTTLQSRRISPEFDFYLYLYSAQTEREIFNIEIFYKIKDKEELLTYRTEGPVTYGPFKVYSIPVSKQNLVESIAIDKEVEKDFVDIISLTVSCGARYATFFVDNSIRYCNSFLFRNMFNSVDWIDITCLTTAKTDVNVSVAELPGKSLLYDRSVEKTFEVITSPLSSSEADFIEQLVESFETYRYVPIGIANGKMGFSLKEILITESDISVSDNNEPQSVKFNWRYADNRLPVVLENPARIFTDEYNKVYS